MEIRLDERDIGVDQVAEVGPVAGEQLGETIVRSSSIPTSVKRPTEIGSTTR